ncbi:MAG TPA: hypothetical protein VGG43_01955 [Acidimicrobiales bacterium]|jgi:hypothetical protein
MSARGRAGKRQWQERQPGYGPELAGAITARSAEQMEGWAERGRVPWWIRVNARLRGQPIVVPDSHR